MIYAIFSGYDSDWNILGYFENKDDAEKYVASYNDAADDYDNYYILKVNSLKRQISRFFILSVKIFK